MTAILIQLKFLGKILSSAATRFYMDDGFSRACALAYSSLLALVPMTAISVQFLGSFNIGRDQALNAITDILERVLPVGEGAEMLLELQNQIFSFLAQLGANVKDLNALTILVLIITTVALFNTIQSAVDGVWRVQSRASIFTKMVYHWMVFTAWLLLIVGSIYTTAYYHSFSEDLAASYSKLWSFASLTTPIAITWLALTILYKWVPSARVRTRDAMNGALLSALLFELLKKAFAYYVSRTTTYSALYGILASVPLFLFWLYLIWVVVLFGAHISFQSGSISVYGGLRRYATELGELGSLLGVRIMQIVAKRFKTGEEPMSEGEIAIETGSDPVLIRTCLEVLSEGGLLSEADSVKHTRTLIKSANTVTVEDILRVFQSRGHFLGEDIDTKDEELRNGTLKIFEKAIRKHDKPFRSLSLNDLAELNED